MGQNNNIHCNQQRYKIYINVITFFLLRSIISIFMFLCLSRTAAVFIIYNVSLSNYTIGGFTYR